MKLNNLIERFQMAARVKADDLPKIEADFAIVGAAIDDRGTAALDHAKRSAKYLEHCEYEVLSQQIKLGGSSFSPDLLHAELAKRKAKSILLECTTLGTAEIALCCRALAQNDDVTLSFLYIEPNTYRTFHQEGVIHRRDFELSTQFQGFHAIPGMCYQMDEDTQQTTVLLLGFEGDRAQRALENLKISPNCIASVFGVPAFQFGWEYDAFANNLSTLVGRTASRGVHFCGADNPKAVLQYLMRLRDGYPDEDTFFLAPLGPKPQALGAVLFAAFSDRVGLLYDYPVRKKSRSSSVAKWHLFQTSI